MKQLFTLMLLVAVMVSYAQKIPFQGKLTENDEPVNGPRDFVFNLPSYGWSESYTDINVLDGYYSVILGSVTPLPDSLFIATDEVQLVISVEGTSLSPITLYKPYTAPVYTHNFDGTNDRPALLVKQTGVSGSNYSALEVISETQGEAWPFFAQATGPGSNYAMYGYAAGTGKVNYGGYGVARGAGDGTTTSFNNGLVGWAADNTWGNTGVYARAFGTAGKVNFGLNAVSTVNDGTDSIVNVGVQGRASGPGINYSIQGVASTSGAVNYAGWFEGDVNVIGGFNVDGELSVNGQPLSIPVLPEAGQFSSLDLYGPAQLYRTDSSLAVRIDPNFGMNFHGPDGEVNNITGYNWIDGGTEAVNRGAIFLFADTASRSVDGFDIRRAEFKISDDGFGRGVGRIKLAGPEVGDQGIRGFFEAGAYSEDGTAHYGKVMLRGADSDIPQVELKVADIGNGAQEGHVTIYDAAGKLKADLSRYANGNAGNLRLYGHNDSLRVLVGTRSAGKTGHIGVYDSLGRNSLELNVSPGGIGSLYTYDQKLGSYPSGWFGNNGNGGFWQIVGSSGIVDPSHTSGAIYTGHFNWNSGLPLMVFEGSYQGVGNFASLVTIGAENADGTEKGYLRLNSKTRALAGLTPGISLGTNGQDFGYFEMNGGTEMGWQARLVMSVDSLGSLGSSGRIGILSPFNDGGGNPKEMISLGITNDAGGADPTGAAGEIFLYGNNSVNFKIGSQAFDQHDMPEFLMYGSNTDGGGWFPPALRMNVVDDGIYQKGLLNLFVNQEGGFSQPTVELSGNIYDQHGGGISFRNFNGQSGVDIFGSVAGSSSGELVMNGPNSLNILMGGDYGSNADLARFVMFGGNLDAGGSTQANSNLFVFEDGLWQSSSLQMYNTMFDSIASTVEVSSNLYGSQAGGIELRNYAGTSTIQLYGESGQAYAVAFNNTSDARLKENVASLTGSLDKVKMLKGVSFEWISDESNASNIGFIAQEVETVYPEVVSTKQDGYKSVNYAALVAALVESIKELDAKIGRLENENQLLRAELKSSQEENAEIVKLRADIEGIKKLVSMSASLNTSNSDSK